ncbi:MAG: GNAT family N-acetyltransferase [Planctomycetales bacterium]
MSWSFDTACEADIDELMTWFPDAHSVDIWGGPRFRFPFDRETFFADCRWQDFTSFCLRNPENELAAFGQLGSRYDRFHLARLVANPGMRGQGVGRKLMEMMIEAARKRQDHSRIALFVYKDNEPAYRCYQALGFEVQEYPEGAPMSEKCFYLARSVA